MLMFWRISHCFNASCLNLHVLTGFFFGGGAGGGLIGWLATPILEEPSIKQILKDCEHYGRNKLRQTLWTDASFTLYTLYTLDYRYFQILCYKKRHARN